MHIFHRWGRWQDAEATWRKPNGREFITQVQVRECEKCGKKKVRKLT